MRLSKVVDLFLDDCRTRRLSEETITGYESSLKFLIATATVGPGDHVQHFTEGLVETFFAALVKRGLATSTLITRRAAVMELARYCLRKRLVSHDPTLNAPKYKLPYRLPRPFTTRERARLMALTETVREVERARERFTDAQGHERMRRVIERVRIPLPRREAVMRAVFYYAGIRVGTLCRLRVQDIVEDGGEYVFRLITKGNREVPVPIVPDLVPILRDWIAEATDLRPTAFLFANQHGGPLSRAYVETLVRGWGRAADVPGCTPHRWRHTAGRELLESGATLEETQGFLGHARIATTQVYRRLLPKHVADAAARRAEMMRGEPPG